MSKMPVKELKYPYPSRFGSSKSMLVDVPSVDGMCTCEDEYGLYQTEEWRLDNNLTDPNRTATSRIGKLFEGRKKEEK